LTPGYWCGKHLFLFIFLSEFIIDLIFLIEEFRDDGPDDEEWELDEDVENTGAQSSSVTW